MVFRSVYGLLCPKTHEIKYIGQATNPKARIRSHIVASRTGTKAVHAWIRSLAPSEPVLVVLQKVQCRRVWSGVASANLVTIMEAKWLKRFRLTALNEDREICAAYHRFANNTELEAYLNG